MEFKNDDEDENTVGEATVSTLFWLTVLLALGTLAHRLFF